MINPAKKLLKFVASIVAILILLAIGLLVTGNEHVITAVRKSILIGQFGPQISDLNLFPHTSISYSKRPFEFPKNKELQSLSPEEQSFHKELSSTSFMLIQRDTVLMEHYWDNHTLLSVSNSFSMAKSVTATLCAIAVKEGYLGWDDPISIYLKEYRGKELGKLTMAQLLSMSAATSWTESGGNPFSDNARAYYGEDLAECVTSVSIEGKPGQVFNYQSGNTGLAGLVLTKALNRSLSSYAEEKLWKTIGAADSAYWTVDEANGLEKAFCCFYASTRDFAKLGRLWLNEGMWDSTEVISPIQYDFMTRPFAKDQGPCKDACYGVGFWLENYQGLDIIYARGILGQYIIMIPELEAIIVRTGRKRDKKNDRHHPKDLYVYLDQSLSRLDR